jgi:HAD superfamily hydrolase (TIGR01450 family)
MYDVTTAKLFLLDMDGTFYLDDTLLPGALEFLALCRATGRQFAFLTNNSSKSKADYLAKLTRLGADVTEHDIFTSGDATLLYLAENGFSKDILLIGTPSLEAQFAAEGYTVRAAKPRAVVLGFDTTITYNKLRLLCDAVRAGLPYIATHPDYNCPVAGGFVPDIGAVIAFVKASTGRDPDAVIGKPNAYIARAAAHKYGVSLEDVCMVGDRLYTDIALGACGCGTALVLCGETTPEVISGIIADEAAIGMVNSKTTAVRAIPAIGKKVGEELEFGGLLGSGPVMNINQTDCSVMIHRKGRIPAPIQALKN